jgi:hypothetical protein
MTDRELRDSDVDDLVKGMIDDIRSAVYRMTCEFSDETRLKELPLALASAQKAIKPPVKNKKVDFQPQGKPRVKYNYADLADVIEAIREPLAANGLSYSHTMGFQSDQYGMRTVLIHSSGERLSTWYPLPHPKDMRPQEFGSALTYARRYSISCLVGIASEDDDDGQAVAHADKPKPAAAVQPKPQPKAIPTSPSSVKPPVRNEAPASEAQVKKLFAMGKERMISQDVLRGTLKGLYGIESTKDLKRWHMDELYETLADPDCGDAKLMAMVAAKQKEAGQ